MAVCDGSQYASVVVKAAGDVEQAMNERRKNRSSFRGEALRLWLEAVTKRSGCESMAVGDESGLAAAGTDPARLDQIASEAAVHAIPGQEAVTTFGECQMLIRTLEIDHQRIVVAAVGSLESCRHALEEAGWGVRRIMD